MMLQPGGAQPIRRQDRRLHARRGDLERHVVNGFAGGAAGLGHRHDLRRRITGDAHLRQRDRQADAMAKRQHGFNLRHRAVLQHQLCQVPNATFSP